MDAYPHLFSPITIGTLEIKNRGIMAPMVVGLCGRDGEVTEDFIPITWPGHAVVWV